VTDQQSEDLVRQVSERVREALAEGQRRSAELVAEAEQRAQEAIAEAQGRAREIVAQAEREAERIRTTTEQEARERVERARAALDELGAALNPRSAASSAGSPATAPEEAPAEATPAPVAEPEPEPEPATPEPESAAEREPERPSGGPSTGELIAQLRGTETEPAGGSEDAGEEGDPGAARLVAMNMALDGASREEIDRRLAEGFQVPDRESLLDDVFSRVGR
jgi:hypothetical protein